MCKKAFYIMTFTDLWGQVAETLSDQYQIGPALYVGLEREALQNTALASAPFYDVNDARMAVSPKHINGFAEKALDPDLLAGFTPYQSILYEMTSRFMLGKKNGSFAQRRQYIWQLYRIWEGLFDQYQPDMVIAGSMPHRVFDYVIYIICEKRGIPFIALEPTSLPHLVYACNSVHDQSKLFDDINFSGKKLAPLSDQTKDYFAYVKDPPADYRPTFYSLSGLFSEEQDKPLHLKQRMLKNLPQTMRLSALMINLIIKGAWGRKIGTVFTLPAAHVFSDPPSMPATQGQNMVLNFKAAYTVARSEKWYHNHLSDLDYDKPFIYLPGNFQPERSTVPDAGYFYDYALIFDMLDRAVPDGWQIAYKEHPRSFMRPVALDNPRDIDFFLRLKRACPRLKFLDPKADSKRLVKHCEAVAIASGTTGWEALARGKPVLLFGEYWYGRAQGVYRIDALDQLHQAMAEIEKGIQINEKAVIEFLQRVESVSEDLSYYFKDNVAERAAMSKTGMRVFSDEEITFRKGFVRQMSDYIAKHTAKKAA